MTSPPHRHDASQNVASFACICQFAYFVLLFITCPSCSGPWTWIIAFCSFLQHLTEDLRKRFVSLVFGGELSKWLSAARRFSSAARIELMPQKHGQPSASPQICFITIDRIYKAQHCHTALDENYSMYSENIKYYQTHSKPASTACVRTCCLLRFSPTKLHRAAFLLFIFGIQILSKQWFSRPWFSHSPCVDLRCAMLRLRLSLGAKSYQRKHPQEPYASPDWSHHFNILTRGLGADAYGPTWSASENL